MKKIAALSLFVLLFSCKSLDSSNSDNNPFGAYEGPKLVLRKVIKDTLDITAYGNDFAFCYYFRGEFENKTQQIIKSATVQFRINLRLTNRRFLPTNR